MMGYLGLLMVNKCPAVLENWSCMVGAGGARNRKKATVIITKKPNTADSSLDPNFLTKNIFVNLQVLYIHSLLYFKLGLICL